MEQKYKIYNILQLQQIQVLQDETVEWEPQIKKERLPDFAIRGGRGRGIPGVPLPGGPARAVFKTPRGDQSAANLVGRGRGRGGSQTLNAQEPGLNAQPSAIQLASQNSFPPIQEDDPNLPIADVPSSGNNQEYIGDKKPVGLSEQDNLTKTSVDQIETSVGLDEAKYEDRPLQMSPAKKKLAQDTQNQNLPKEQVPKIAVQKIAPPADSAGENHKSGFFNMITGFLGFLSLRKQAYTGKPASAMYYDEKKGRYIIMGEEESDEDEPPPPPPGARKIGTNELGVSTSQAKDNVDIKEGHLLAGASKEDDGKVTGLNALTSVGFGGALANRGRGRGGRGRGAGPAQTARFPSSFNPANLKEGEPKSSLESPENNQPPANPTEEQEQILKKRVDQTILYQTALDIQENDEAEDKKTAIEDQLNEERDEQLQTSIYLAGNQNRDQLNPLRSQVTFAEQNNHAQNIVSKQKLLTSHKRNQSQNLSLQYSQTAIQNMNNTVYDIPQTSQLLDNSELMMQQLQYDKQREKMWQNKYTKQQERINDYKQKIQRYQNELVRQRGENEQTIENFTQLCQDLKYRGMDEVENLQCQIKLLQEKLNSVSQELAASEFKNERKTFQIEDLHIENEELLIKIQRLNQSIKEMETGMNSSLSRGFSLSSSVNYATRDHQGSNDQQDRIQHNQNNALPSSRSGSGSRGGQNQNQGLAYTMSHQGLSSEVHGVTRVQHRQNNLLANLSYGKLTPVQAQQKYQQLVKMLDLKCENERLQWRFSTLQIDSTNLIGELQKYMKQREQSQELQEDLKKKLKNSDAEVERQKEISKKLKEDYITLKLFQENLQLQNSDFDEEDFEDSSSECEDDIDDPLEQKIKQKLIRDAADMHDRGPEFEIESSMDLAALDSSSQHKLKQSFCGVQENQSAYKFSQRISNQIDRQLRTPQESKQNRREAEKINNQIRDHLKNENIIDSDQRMMKRPKKVKNITQILKEQIEESRVLLKKEMDQRMSIEKDLRHKSLSLNSIAEGLSEISSVLRDICSKERIEICIDNLYDDQSQVSNDKSNYGQSNLESDEDKEELIQNIIKRIQDIKNFYQAQISEANHHLQVKTLKLENLESLTLDLDILTQEKALQDQDLIALKSQLDQSRKQTLEKQQVIFSLELQNSQELESIKLEKENLQRQISHLHYNFERQINEIQTQGQTRLNEFRDHYEKNLMPEVRENAERQVSQIQQKFSATKEENKLLSQQYQTLVQSNNYLEQQSIENRKILLQHERDLKNQQIQVKNLEDQNFQLQQETEDEKNKMLEEYQILQNYVQELKQNNAHDMELQHQELAEQMQTSHDLYEKTQKTLSDEIEGLRLENQRQIDEITQETNQERQMFENELAFANEKKIQLQKDLQSQQDELKEFATLKAALEIKLAEKETEIQTLRSENDKREDQIFWQLVNQVTYLKEQINKMNTQLKEYEERETYLSKNQSAIEKIREIYNEQIDELEKEKDEIVSQSQSFQEQQLLQINQLQKEMDEKEINQQQQNQELKENLAAAEKQNAELKSQIESHGTISNQKLGNESQDEQKQEQTKNNGNSGELQDLLDYQIQINDKLNEKNQNLEALLQEFEAHLAEKTSEIQNSQVNRNDSQKMKSLYHQIQTEYKCLQDQHDQVKSEKDKLEIILKQQKENLKNLQDKKNNLNDEVQITQNNFEKEKQEYSKLSCQKVDQILNKSTFKTETSSLFSDKCSLPQNQEAQNSVTQINFSKPNSEGIEQLEEQLMVQAKELKKLNELNQDLQQKIEQNGSFHIQNLKEQVIDAQFQSEQPIIDFTIQNDENYNKICDLQQELEQCKSTLEFKCNELEEMRINLETLKVQEQSLQDSLTQVAKKNSQYEDREKQFKRAAEDMANKFKEKIKKEKEASIKIQEQNSELQEKLKAMDEANQSNQTSEEEILQLQKQLVLVRQERDDIKIKMDNMIQEQLSLIEHLEGSNNFSVNMDHFKEQDSLNNISSLKKHIDLNLSIFDTKIDALNQERDRILLQILECLQNAGIDGIEDLNTWKGTSFDAVLEKLQILLQNYQEDQRQIKQLLQDNDNIQKENEELKNQNYDLRYELQELNIKNEKLQGELNAVQIDYQKCLKQFEATDSGKLSNQLKQIQEESRILKNDFIAKIESYEQEITMLKDIDSKTADDSQQKVQVSNEPTQTTSTRISQGKYADLSINKDLQQKQNEKNSYRELTQEEANETRIKPSTYKENYKAGQKETQQHAQPAALVRPLAPSSGGGLFTSIASFFLTESDVGSKLRKNQENRHGQQSQREETEYEYYEYDDEDEDVNESPVTMMKEEFEEEEED